MKGLTVRNWVTLVMFAYVLGIGTGYPIYKYTTPKVTMTSPGMSKHFFKNPNHNPHYNPKAYCRPPVCREEEI